MEIGAQNSNITQVYRDTWCLFFLRDETWVHKKCLWVLILICHTGFQIAVFFYSGESQKINDDMDMHNSLTVT